MADNFQLLKIGEPVTYRGPGYLSDGLHIAFDFAPQLPVSVPNALQATQANVAALQVYQEYCEGYLPTPGKLAVNGRNVNQDLSAAPPAVTPNHQYVVSISSLGISNQYTAPNAAHAWQQFRVQTGMLASDVPVSIVQVAGT